MTRCCSILPCIILLLSSVLAGDGTAIAQGQSPAYSLTLDIDTTDFLKSEAMFLELTARNLTPQVLRIPNPAQLSGGSSIVFLDEQGVPVPSFIITDVFGIDSIDLPPHGARTAILSLSGYANDTSSYQLSDLLPGRYTAYVLFAGTPAIRSNVVAFTIHRPSGDEAVTWAEYLRIMAGPPVGSKVKKLLISLLLRNPRSRYARTIYLRAVSHMLNNVRRKEEHRNILIILENAIRVAARSIHSGEYVTYYTSARREGMRYAPGMTEEWMKREAIVDLEALRSELPGTRAAKYIDAAMQELGSPGAIENPMT